ncbi:MAG: pirin family protein [Pseudomonas sp.]|uniref:pirin family protein n=1 Tax=Pseudomonas sp. TaxID=306 RepID=UPI003393DBAE
MSDLPLIQPRAETVAGQPILRALPSARVRSIGPFVFFDHMLPHRYPPGSGMNVRQHPHIGLSTLTYLFEGQLQHRDSLGSDQQVLPGDVSWMTAGAAVAHVERTPDALRATGSAVHGVQVWLAMPRGQEQSAPSYRHVPAAQLPFSESLGVRITLIAGTGFCLESPVPVLSATLYAELQLQSGATLLIDTEHAERALYVLDGELELDGVTLPPRTLAILPAGLDCLLSARGAGQAMLIGGGALDGPRRMNWNFVASDPILIEQARQRWALGDWPRVPGEDERIELPN